MDNTLLLIDGSSFIFRAFHAMPNLTSPSGQPTGAIYGIINMFKQMQKKFPTKNWGCIFDAPGKTFRDHIHPEYKANRKETPEDLISQFEEIYTLIKALGIPVIMQNGIEADDLIGTIAIKAKQSGYNVLIATGDKDFAQLVDKDITLVNTMTDEILDIQGVIDKFGVKPEQIIDYLSLVGDKVDNIPGVDKCGPKTAV
ncbi:MAG TPA: 5'-3' exonuclease H3TH domain-containing protein, partial [Aquella sp.]|nr:5'-3' exonuclease H3TH domain-containing protein [Aquella sp.]